MDDKNREREKEREEVNAVTWKEFNFISQRIGNEVSGGNEALPINCFMKLSMIIMPETPDISAITNVGTRTHTHI